MNKNALAYGLGFVTLWDTVTTIYGTTVILGRGIIQVSISILFGLLITGFLLRTIPIIKNPKEDLISVGSKGLWFLAILYDLFTAYTGNFDLILGNAGGTQKIIVAIGLTVFICSAPIGLSKLVFDPEKK